MTSRILKAERASSNVSFCAPSVCVAIIADLEFVAVIRPPPCLCQKVVSLLSFTQGLNGMDENVGEEDEDDSRNDLHEGREGWKDGDAR